MVKFSTVYHNSKAGAAVRRNATRLGLLLLPFVFFGNLPALRSQIVSINNDYVAAHVNKDQKSARFWISAGPKNGYHRFLYHGSKAAQAITSNVVFRITEGTNNHYYYCNTTPDFALGGRPTVGFKEVPFRPYDSIRVAPDTIEVRWFNIHRYDITMRFVAEKPKTIYDDGADILLEFEYELDPNAAGSIELGIFLMLDGDNGAAVESRGGTGGDFSSIMTSAGYYVSSSHGRVFRSEIGPIPEFYHVGNFEFDPDIPNDLLPVHRLRGVSNGGLPLTTPDVFAVGNWRIYRNLAWNPFSVETVGDVATALQWERLAGKGKIRTAFGSNSKSGNNLFHCRDSLLFADIRCVRLIEQKSENGEYTPSRFAVEMWLTNTGDYDILKPAARLVTPVFSEPDNTERAIIDPSTPATQAVPDSAALLPGFTHKFTWYLNLNPASQDTLIHLQFEIQKDRDKDFAPFYYSCSPLVTVRPFKLPPCDTLAPVIERLGSGRNTTAYWDLQTYDRHPGFDYDTGLDSIGIIENEGNNFRLTIDPATFNRCDVKETVRMRAEVIDTSRRGRLVFWVRDCRKGSCPANRAIDSIIYNPRPDTYAPTVLSRDSVGSWDPAQYPCNARLRTVTLLDSIHQRPEAGDYGLGSVNVLLLQNFKDPVITDQRGEANIRDFDSRATITLEVEDSLSDAEAQIRVTDYAGNDTVLYFYYCTIDDFLPPTVEHVQTSSTEWTVTATDSAEWDRGLFEVEVISNLNGNIAFVWPDGSLRDSVPELSKGIRTSDLNVQVVNKCDPAELILEFRDTYYGNNPENHRRFDTIRYAGIPDELAPNVIIRPGFDGTTYTFDVTINDIHFDMDGDLFECDRGIERVNIFYTSNLRIRDPLTFNGPMEATLSLEVIDTLAIDRTDTICVTAIDSAGNSGEDCAYWPSAPDGKSPVFIGKYDRGTAAITGIASDDRENDRGLGSVTLRGSVNLDNAFGMPGLRGRPNTTVSISSGDPESEIAGEIVIQDLYGEILATPENSIHTIVIPFRLPVARVEIRMPELVETETEFDVSVVAANDIDGDLVRTLSVELQSTGPAVYVAPGGPQQTLAGSFGVTSAGGNRFLVNYTAAPGEQIAAGDVLGTLRFRAVVQSTTVEPFFVKIVPGTESTNDNQESMIVVRKVPTDPLSSQLTLPAPLLRIAGDSLTYINGDCNRVLGGTAGGKPVGVAILAIEPQPIRTGQGGFTAVLRGLAEEGGEAEWIAPDGRRVALFRLQGNPESVVRYTIPVPDNADAGLYFLRITGKNGTDSRKILILE